MGLNNVNKKVLEFRKYPEKGFDCFRPTPWHSAPFFPGSQGCFAVDLFILNVNLPRGPLLYRQDKLFLPRVRLACIKICSSHSFHVPYCLLWLKGGRFLRLSLDARFALCSIIPSALLSKAKDVKTNPFSCPVTPLSFNVSTK